MNLLKKHLNRNSCANGKASGVLELKEMSKNVPLKEGVFGG